MTKIEELQFITHGDWANNFLTYVHRVQNFCLISPCVIISVVVALPEPVDQGKGGKREAFPSRTRGSGRDAMEIRYTEASVIIIG